MRLVLLTVVALAAPARAAWQQAALTPRVRQIVMSEPEATSAMAPKGTSAITKRSNNDVAIAAGALGAAMVMGADLAALDAAAHAEAAIAVGTAIGVAASADKGTLGETLRTVGNVTVDLAEATISTATEIEKKYDVTTYARAVLEVGYDTTLDWWKRRRARKEAAVAAPRAQRGVALPSVDLRPAARTLSEQQSPAATNLAATPLQMRWQEARDLRTRDAFRAVRAGALRKRAFVRSRLSRWFGRAPAE